MKKNTIDDFYKRVDKVDEPDGCWFWTASKSTNGYGAFRYHGKLYRAHKWLYEYYHGAIPEGLELKHSCDNRACVNPLHLSIGTHQENMREMVERGRNAKGERNNTAKLSEIEVNNIRALYAIGGVSMKSLGERFKVDGSTVCDIINRKIWRELPSFKKCETCNGRGWYLKRFTDNHRTVCVFCNGNGAVKEQTANATA